MECERNQTEVRKTGAQVFYRSKTRNIVITRLLGLDSEPKAVLLWVKILEKG